MLFEDDDYDDDSFQPAYISYSLLSKTHLLRKVRIRSMNLSLTLVPSKYLCTYLVQKVIELKHAFVCFLEGEEGGERYKVLG